MRGEFGKLIKGNVNKQTEEYRWRETKMHAKQRRKEILSDCINSWTNILFTRVSSLSIHTVVLLNHKDLCIPTFIHIFGQERSMNMENITEELCPIWMKNMHFCLDEHAA